MQPGFDSIIWRKRWERTQDDELKTRLLRYNQEDCLALKMVTDFILSCNRDKSPSRVSWSITHFLMLSTRASCSETPDSATDLAKYPSSFPSWTS